MKKSKLNAKAWTVFISMIIMFNMAMAGNEKEIAENEFSLDELKSHIYFLASDYLGGRVTDEPGYGIAAEYVKTQFKAAGLSTFIESREEHEAYFHSFSLLRKDYHTDAPIIVRKGDEEKTFEHLKDFKLVNSGTGGMPEDELDIVFLGFGIEEPREGWNDYQDLEVKGKNVLILSGAPKKRGKAILSQELDDLYSSKQGLNKKLINLIGKNPAAIMLIESDDLEGFYDRVQSRTEAFSNEYKGCNYRMDMRETFYRLYLIKSRVAKAMLENTKIDLDKILTGKLPSYKAQILPDVKTYIPLKTKVKEVHARNVIGMIPGTDSTLKDEYLLVGGHLDHEPNFNGMVNNGADDNASGVTAVIELAQYFAKHPLKRPIVFAAWAAEEGGCYGSRNFVETFPGNIHQIVAAINLDCVGRNGRNAEERFQTYMLDAGKICPDMVTLVDRINAETVNFRIEKEMHPRWGTSDQESFINAGVPVVDFFNGGTIDLHRPTDDAEKIDWEYLQKMCILGKAIAEELGNMEGRMCGDGPLGMSN